MAPFDGPLVVVDLLTSLESRTGYSIRTTAFWDDVVYAVALAGFRRVQIHVRWGYTETLPPTDGTYWSESIAAPLVLAAGEASDENPHSRTAIAGQRLIYPMFLVMVIVVCFHLWLGRGGVDREIAEIERGCLDGQNV